MATKSTTLVIAALVIATTPVRAQINNGDALERTTAEVMRPTRTKPRSLSP